MKFSDLSFCFFLMVFSAPAFGKSAWPVTVDLGETINSYDDLKIRVKVFPHKRDYLPHRKDTTRDYVEINSEGLCRIYRGAPQQAAKLNSTFVQEQNLKLHVVNLHHPLWLECDQPTTVQRQDGVPSYTYSGSFYIYNYYNKAHREKEIHIVNIIDLETYLRGVVPSEVYTSWPMESLKSQAVAARTYALFHLSVARTSTSRAKPYNYFYDVDDTILYQAYTGLTHTHPRTNEAIDETHSIVLTHNNQLIQAYYHADSGGLNTESAGAVWGMDVPYAKSKKEPYSQVHLSSWKTSISKLELTTRLQQAGVLSATEQIRWIAPLAEHITTTGRIKKVLVRTVCGQSRTLDMRTLRSSVRLNSNNFVIKVSGSDIFFEGRGSGHGVGMSQKGSQILAKVKGWTFDRILEHYYTQTRVCALLEAKSPLPKCLNLVSQDLQDKSSS